MGLKIVRGHEPLQIKNVKILLYGEPGAGKTSLGFSAKNPLLIDFDHRTYTAKNRRDAVDVSHWSEIGELTSAVLRPYDTVIIDTVGRALDMLQFYLVETDPKLANRTGALTLQGYGSLKSQFTAWLRQLTQMGKDVVLIAHNKEDKDGDIKIVRPDIMGGSYNEVMKVVDFAGFLYMGEHGKRLLNFSPTSTSVGKNSANLDVLTIPDLSIEPDWFDSVIDTMKKTLGSVDEKTLQQAAILEEWRDTIAGLAAVGDVNRVYAEIQQIGKPLSIQLWELLKQQAAALNLHFDKTLNVFVGEQNDEMVKTEQSTKSKTNAKKAA